MHFGLLKESDVTLQKALDIKPYLQIELEKEAKSYFTINTHKRLVRFQEIAIWYFIITSYFPVCDGTDSSQRARYSVLHNLLKNSLAVKKGAALFKMASVWKKVWNQRGRSRNGCDGIGWWQNFNNSNSGEFCADSWWSWDEATQINLNCCY